MGFGSPKFTSANYQHVLLDPVDFYPAPQPSETVPESTLVELRTYIDLAMRRAFTSVTQPSTAPGPGVARIRVAITAVGREGGLKAYQLIPAALVFTAATLAGPAPIASCAGTVRSMSDSCHEVVRVEEAGCHDRERESGADEDGEARGPESVLELVVTDGPVEQRQVLGRVEPRDDRRHRADEIRRCCNCRRDPEGYAWFPVPAPIASAVQQIIHIETDTEVCDPGFCFQFFDSFFLLRIVRDDPQTIGRNLEFHSAVLLVRENCSSLQRRPQSITAYANLLVGAYRDDGFIVGKAPIDQFGRKNHGFASHPKMISSEFKFNRAFAGFE